MQSDIDSLIGGAPVLPVLSGVVSYNTLPASSTTGHVKAKKLPQYVAAIAATFSALAAGIILGWTSPIVDDLKNGNYNNITADDSQLGWIGSLTTIGALVTCIPTGFVCDHIGSKNTLLLLVVPFTVGWGLIWWAQNLAMLYAGRFVTGIGAGACCVAAPMYTSEIAHKDIRGALGSYFQLMVTIGVLYAYVFGAVTNVKHYTLLCSFIPLLFVVAFAMQPNAPVYLLKKGKYEKAKKSLLRLRGHGYDADGELNELEGTMKNNEPNIGLLRIFRKRATQRALFISLMLMVFQQLSGINAVIFYTSDIFEDAGSKIDPKLATIAVGTFQVIATFISSLIVDKLGRRALLMFSAFFMSFAMILLAGFFTMKQHKLVSDPTIEALSFLPVVALILYIIVFSLGLGPIPWMINGEIFTSDVKGVASSISSTFNWFLAFLITKLFLQVDKDIGEDISFFFFATILLIATLFVYLFVPETKGKAVYEIQDELENSSMLIH